jgi:hypothetical protein
MYQGFTAERYASAACIFPARRLDADVRLDRSEALSAIEFPEIAIEGPEGKMPGLPGDLQNQAIRKAKRWFVPKVRQRRRDHVRILERETPVIQKHVYGGDARLGVKLVN